MLGLSIVACARYKRAGMSKEVFVNANVLALRSLREVCDLVPACLA